MKKAEMKPFKEILLALRSRVRGDVSAMADGALSKSGGSGGGSTLPSHIADMGTDTYEQANTLRLMDSEGDTLALIEGALERIEDGVYGSCVECSGRVPKCDSKPSLILRTV